MVRSFLPPERLAEGEVSLSGEEAHHLSRVLRVRPGDPVVLFDGQGREADAVVRKARPGEILLQAGPIRSAPAPEWTITLGISVPGNVKLDTIVNQATQLGAGRIIPVTTERSVVRVPPEKWRSKGERLGRIAVEAAKQSGVPHVPTVAPLTPWADVLASFPLYDLVLLASVGGPHEPLSGLVRGRKGGNILLLIGPEGDFTPQETRAAVAASARLFSLGPTVLRCDTAASSSLSLVSFFLREPWEPPVP
ncbi:MAG: 16S rRNA (uracil(1498)-N(3))-methyltransferase [Candidatus Omnitrophica bacterium]|nr:16S rRNA (uracil(1498)-N(3))-methyltransferase [Candidatus Omnitrophota bacterium]